MGFGMGLVQKLAFRRIKRMREDRLGWRDWLFIDIELYREIKRGLSSRNMVLVKSDSICIKTWDKMKLGNFCCKVI